MCIDQTDSDAKARGIDQIGRFLRNSDELLILCVYCYGYCYAHPTV
jgi:hypothetical protein